MRRTRVLFRNNTSGYKGVGKKGNHRWYARIYTDGKRMHLGYFNSPKDAAIAYDTYIIENDLKHKLNGVIK
jgi:hypothetical protein